MDTASLGFLLWSLFFFLMLLVFVYSAWRASSVDEKTEDIAEQCLPEIGRIAEKRVRRATGETPKPTEWYPQKKRMGEHHA